MPEQTPLPTLTPAPTATALPAPGVRIIATGAPVIPTVIPQREGQLTQIRYSRYWPALGGVNCGSFVDGVCVSRMASGARWQDWTERAAACPRSWAFGTVIVLPDGSEWTCKDRGGAIVYGADGIPWVDMLTEYPTHSFGEIVSVEVRW